MTADECALSYQNDILTQDLPGVRIIRRLKIDDDWFRTMSDALVLCAGMGGYEKPREIALNRLLDLQDDPLSTIERRIIIDYCLHRSEA